MAAAAAVATAFVASHEDTLYGVPYRHGCMAGFRAEGGASTPKTI